MTSQAIRIRIEQMSRLRNNLTKINNDVSSLKGEDKILFEISNLQSKIKNIKYDLENNFQGNVMLFRKLQIIKEQLKSKEMELNNLKNE